MKSLLLLSFSVMPLLFFQSADTTVRASKTKAAYWVVETGPEKEPYTIVRFFNANHETVFEQKTTGVNLNASRPSTQRKLNRAVRKHGNSATTGTSVVLVK